jgi:UDP-N-acetylglucosamine 3-dehydrogenase
MTRVGIIGGGGMGNVHARHYRAMPDVQLHFFERDPLKAKAFQATHGASASVSAEALIADCDVVDLCLPTDLHLEFGLKTISAGKALFMEKPLAKTLEEAAQVVNAAASAGVPLMPGQVVRFFPEFKEGNRLVACGHIGKPAAARTRRGGPAPLKGADNWFMDHRRSGGVLIDLAVHDFDWLRWTLGEVKTVYSCSVGAHTMAGPDYALTTLSFDSGAVAHVEATWMDPAGFRTSFEVCGSGGMIEFDSRSVATVRTATEGKVQSEGPVALSDDPYYNELRGFVEAVQKGTPPPVSGYDGLMALSIGLAAVESAQSGQVVAPARHF